MPHARPPRPVQAVIALLAVTLLFGPAVVRAAGHRAASFENRPLASFPALQSGWGFFGALPGWASDHLPLRDRAVLLDAHIDQRVFGDPYRGPVDKNGWPQVVVGRDDQWFFGGDFEMKCTATVPVEQVRAGFAELVTALRASGRRVVVTAAPDKSTVMVDHLPDSVRGKDCAHRRSAAGWAAMSPEDWFLDPRPAIARAARTSPYEPYMTHDTHWDGVAAAAWVRAVVERIAPQVAQGFAERPGPTVSLPADLGLLAGLPGTMEFHPVTLADPRVREQPVAGARVSDQPLRLHAHGPPGTVVRARTLLLGDSFAQGSLNVLRGVFRDLTVLQFATAGYHAATVMAEIQRADVVVVEEVERGMFTGDMAVYLPYLAQAVRALPPPA